MDMRLYNRKSMLRCGLGRIVNGDWEERQLSPHLEREEVGKIYIERGPKARRLRTEYVLMER